MRYRGPTEGLGIARSCIPNRILLWNDPIPALHKSEVSVILL